MPANTNKPSHLTQKKKKKNLHTVHWQQTTAPRPWAYCKKYKTKSRAKTSKNYLAAINNKSIKTISYVFVMKYDG
jgi:hypothetical protein